MPNDFHAPVATELADGSTLVSLHDGTFSASNEVLVDPAGDDATASLRASFPEGVRIDVNAFALRRDGETILIDAGAGTAWGPALGNVAASLATIGVDPGAMTTILLTHPHGDHTLGLLDDAGGLRYPNAEVYCPSIDIDHFSVERAGERSSYAIARRIFTSLGPRLRGFGPGEILPGIEAISLPGHTPGHSGFLIGALHLIWGDTVHLPEIQGPRPELGLAFDEDPATAIATRRQVFATIAEKQWTMSGMHLDFPALGRVEAEGNAFRVILGI